MIDEINVLTNDCILKSSYYLYYKNNISNANQNI